MNRKIILSCGLVVLLTAFGWVSAQEPDTPAEDPAAEGSLGGLVDDDVDVADTAQVAIDRTQREQQFVQRLALRGRLGGDAAIFLGVARPFQHLPAARRPVRIARVTPQVDDIDIPNAQPRATPIPGIG